MKIMEKIRAGFFAVAVLNAAPAIWAQGPTITNLAVTAMTSSTVTIQWTTNQASSSQLIYGIWLLDQATPVVGTLVTSHSITLTGLTGGQVWEYEAVSVNSAGNSTTSTAQQFELCDSGSSATVSGTVNNYYEYGLYTITWQNQSGQSVSPTLCGAPLQQTWTGGLDHGASFGLNLPNNLEIVPSPSNWEMGVTGIDGSIGAFNITFSNSTPSTNITGALQSAATGNLIHVWYDPATSTFYPPISSGVSQIIAGTNVTISPSGGTGAVTINSTGGAGGNPAAPVGSLQYNNDGAFGGANGDYNTSIFNALDFGQIQYTSVDTFTCDGTNCTFEATNNFLAGEPVLLDYTFSASCLYGTVSPALSTGLSSSQFELVESDTQCTGVQSGYGGYASSDNAGLWVYGGLYGISLTAAGSYRGETPPPSGGITLCATDATAPQCAAGDANVYEINMTADLGIFMFSPHKVEIEAAGGLRLQNSDDLSIPGSLVFFAGATPPNVTPNEVQIAAPPSSDGYTVILPSSQTAGALTNDGSGNLAWIPSAELAANNTFTGTMDTTASSPAVQGLVSSTHLFGAGFVRVVGKYAYVTADGGTPGYFNVIDISDPTAPYLISSITSTQMTNGAEEMECVGTYCYMVTYGGNSFVVIDVSKAEAPVQVGHITDSTHFANATAMAVSGKYAIVGSGPGSSTNYLNVIDISNPTSPQLLNSVSDANMHEVGQLALKGKYLYVCTYTGVFSIWDASALPALTDVSHTASSIVGGFYLADRYVYGVYSSNVGTPPSTFSVLDVSNPTATPTVVGSTTTAAAAEWTIKCGGNYCYVTDLQQNGLMVFNISNPATPTLVTEIFDNTNLLGADDIFLDGDYAYIANNGSGTTGSMAIYRITGENFTAASIGNLQAGDANIDNTLVVGKDLTVKNGINVGLFGISTNGPVTSPNVRAAGSSAAVGYVTGSGAGCSITQITSRTTGVTCTGNTGQITLFTAAGSATAATFTVTDTSVGATDTVQCSEASGSNLYLCSASAVAGGSFQLTFYTTGGTASDAPVFNFTVLKGSAN